LPRTCRRTPGQRSWTGDGKVRPPQNRDYASCPRLATIIPRHNYPASGTNTGWQPAKSKIRHEVNQWIRTKAAGGGVLDFDNAIRDPMNPEVNYPSFHCGGIHPSPHGYWELAKTIPLTLFRDRSSRSTNFQ
jgi:hypothetical protein